jgi:hypothetical protein
MITALVAFALVIPAAAAPPQQAYYLTPTPGADGRIMYTIKEGDTCISISLLNNVSVEQLRTLNNIVGTDCPVILGQKLLLGTVQSVTPTPGASPTPAPILPTPTPFNGSASVCIMLFDDVNGNGIAETGESMLAGGAVSLTDRIGKISKTGSTTAGPDLLCYADIPEGDYNISVAVPEGYNATTNTNYPLKVAAGDQTVLDFGAQISVKALPPLPSEGGRSPLLGILGAVLVLGGIGLAIFMFTMRR